MNKMENMQKAMITAMKNKEKLRKETISGMIDAVRKATITDKGRIEITDELVDTVILKEQKTVLEMINTCPDTRPDLLEQYKAKYEIVNEFAPVLMTDLDEIRTYVTDTLDLEISKQNRGQIMQLLKGKADMKIANQLFGEK